MSKNTGISILVAYLVTAVRSNIPHFSCAANLLPRSLLQEFDFVQEVKNVC